VADKYDRFLMVRLKSFWMNKPNISIIAAVSENGVIGEDNRMPWHLPSDLDYFKSITWGNLVIMGRRTYESIGKPLPGRVNIVFSSNELEDDVWSVKNVEEFQMLWQEKTREGSWKDKELFVIGGAELFRLFLPLARKLYITRIHADFPGDTHFPEIDRQKWQLVSTRKGIRDEENRYEHDFLIYVKRREK